MKQIDATHYRFSRYFKRERWASLWHQIDEILDATPQSVLEIGPGPGVLKAILQQLGVASVETLDIDPELKPDHVSSADALPFADNAFDVVCAFQMLEHVPYQTSLQIFGELSRVARSRAIISLPDAQPGIGVSLHVSRVGTLNFPVSLPVVWPRRHDFDGQHYWELNKRGYRVNRVQNDLQSVSGLELVKTFRVGRNLYHRFFVFSKR